MNRNLRGATVIVMVIAMSLSVMAQVPGSDYGPEGWSAGLKQADMGCYELGLSAAGAALLAFIPGLSEIYGPLAAMLSFIYAGVCAS